ncbi:MAG: hypothetical protein AAF322_00555 [Pseudomonadota bacterium]
MLTETAPPTFTPSQSDELARHMRLPSGFGTDHGAEIEDAWRAAVAHLEAKIGVCLAPRSFVWRGRLDPYGSTEAGIAPVRAIVSAATLDDEGASTPVDAALLSFDRGAFRTRFCAPTLAGDEVEIVFEAGFGDDWSASPASLRRAVFLVAAHFFDMRHAAGDRTVETPFGVEALIRPWTPLRLTPRAS